MDHQEKQRLAIENETLRCKLQTLEKLGAACDDVQLLRLGYAAARQEIESLKATNLELERLCDATYVTQGADAYNHACSMMEQYQAERKAARKEVGTERSLCDGISWLYTRIASLESQLEGGKSEALADLAYAHGMTTGWNLCIADKHDEFARIRSMRSSQAISTIEAPQPAAQAQEDVPDMFWDADDTENFAHEIQDIIDGYGPGEIVTIECAKRLPNFRVVVTRDGDGLSYEYLEAATAAQQGEAT